MWILSRTIKARAEEEISLIYSASVNGALGMAISVGAYGEKGAAGAVLTGPLGVLVLMILLLKVLKSNVTY